MVRAFAVQFDSVVVVVFEESASKARAKVWRTLHGIYSECNGSWFAQLKVRRWPMFDAWLHKGSNSRPHDPCELLGKKAIESPFGPVYWDWE